MHCRRRVRADVCLLLHPTMGDLLRFSEGGDPLEEASLKPAMDRIGSERRMCRLGGEMARLPGQQGTMQDIRGQRLRGRSAGFSLLTSQPIV